MAQRLGMGMLSHSGNPGVNGGLNDSYETEETGFPVDRRSRNDGDYCGEGDCRGTEEDVTGHVHNKCDKLRI